MYLSPVIYIDFNPIFHAKYEQVMLLLKYID